ncbi:MAG: Nif11-like leader peptide family natural product precursor [Leptolyngbya sp. SIO4C1]|nr:Nif11-like leader peptide family natural product precursor [Leptolyngbya sp. SIO4C1]
MPQKNAARMYREVQQAQAREERRKALSNPEAFVKMAAARGYTFTVENLESQLAQLSDEAVAAIFNPGIPPRHHLFPR